MNEAKPDINKVLFMHLVSMLAMSAIQQMGKLMDPGTGKAEINLEAAQATIDMLDMLFTKTKNNLDADEEKLMKDTLSSLKMNFVETKDEEERKPDGGRRTTDNGPAKAGGGADARHQTPDDGPAKAGGGADARRQTPDDGPTKAGNGNEDKTPKYHKKYE